MKNPEKNERKEEKQVVDDEGFTRVRSKKTKNKERYVEVRDNRSLVIKDNKIKETAKKTLDQVVANKIEGLGTSGAKSNLGEEVSSTEPVVHGDDNNKQENLVETTARDAQSDEQQEELKGNSLLPLPTQRQFSNRDLSSSKQAVGKDNFHFIAGV